MRIKPKLDELKKKYGDDKQRYSQEMQKLYSEEKISMGGGCLPLLIRLPIMFSIYYLITQPLTYLMNISSETIDKLAKTLNLAEGSYTRELTIIDEVAKNNSLSSEIAAKLDNIDFTDHTKYGLKVDADQLIWLTEVLEQNPDIEHIAVCMHAPATSPRTGGFIPYAKPIVSILGDRKVDFITGHGHRHGTYEHGDNIIEHSVAQVSGNLWFAPICADGTPQGVFCIEERDGEWMWHHRILGKSADEALVVYPMGRVAEHEEYVVVKVVGWDSKWRLSWSEDGADMGAMEQIKILDPDYMYYVENEANYREKYMQRLRRSARPHSHYFRCKPTAENSDITITATDRFGRVYSAEL